MLQVYNKEVRKCSSCWNPWFKL